MRITWIFLAILLGCGQPTQTFELEAADKKEAPKETQPATPDDPAPEPPIEEALSNANWKTHSALDEIRTLVQSIDEGSMNTDEKRFEAPCETEKALASKLIKDNEGRVRMLETTKGVDVWRLTRQYYDEAGQLRFASATFNHSSAESKRLSRRYLNADGTTLFEPEVEQLSENAGPDDPEAMDRYIIAQATDAATEHSRLLAACDTAKNSDCCCHHNDPAGAGLSRFSRDQGTCDGSIYMKGCVDSGICDVATLEKSKAVARLVFKLPSGKAVSILGDPNRIYDHGDDAIVLYDDYSAEKASALLFKNMKPSPTNRSVDAAATESHGKVLRFEFGSEQIAFDIEANCQGSTGSCIWLPSRPTVEK